MVKDTLEKLNLPKKICDHMLGEKHSIVHRVLTGLCVCYVGVLVSKIGGAYVLVHIIMDGVGYIIHGIGCIPIIDLVAEAGNGAGNSTGKEEEKEVVEEEH